LNQKKKLYKVVDEVPFHTVNKAHDESDDDDDDDDDDSRQDENFESGIFICIISLFKDSFYA